MGTRAVTKSREAFVAACHKSGLRVTPQRTAVFECLTSSKEHPTAEQVFRIVRDRHPNVSLDTISRTLRTFVEMGLANVAEGFGGSRRYDANLAAHHHAHCVHCGIIIDFENAAFDRLKAPPQVASEFDIIDHKVVISGVCARCRDKEQQ